MHYYLISWSYDGRDGAVASGHAEVALEDPWAFGDSDRIAAKMYKDFGWLREMDGPNSQVTILNVFPLAPPR